jgi:hypothetical protein
MRFWLALLAANRAKIGSDKPPVSNCIAGCLMRSSPYRVRVVALNQLFKLFDPFWLRRPSPVVFIDFFNVKQAMI